MDKATPDSAIQVTLLKPVIWMESGIAGDWHIMVQYADDAPFEYAALFYRYGYTDNATIHRAATEIAVSIGANEPVEERQRPIRAEVERLAAQAAPSSAIIASLCGDVEPVALMWQHDETGRTGFVEHATAEELEQWECINRPRRFVAKLYPASTVAALKAENDALRARVAELEKDAARLEFVCNSPNRMVERENGLWRVYEDVAPTDRPTAVWQGITPRWHVTPREAIDAAITAALTKGQP